MGRKKTTSEFKVELKKAQPNLKVLGKYTNANNYILVEDELGIKYKAVANILLRNKSVTAKSAVSKNDWFVRKSKAIHKDSYIYDKVDFSKLSDKVTVTCKIHGDFIVSGDHHLYSKSGCPECAKETSGWTYTSWEKQGESSKHFDGFKVYIIRCYNDDEDFIKIGKTFMVLGKRFNSTRMPYEYEVLKEIKGSARFVSELERSLHNEHRNLKYFPKIKFAGNSECFTQFIQ